MSDNAAPAGHRWPVVVLRVLTVVLLVQIIAQATLAGGFVTGDVGLLGVHTANGILLALTSTLLVPAAVLLWRPGRGPRWPIPFSAGFWFLTSVQLGFGFDRQIGLHIPLGVAMFGVISGFTWWAWAYRRRPVAVTA